MPEQIQGLGRREVVRGPDVSSSANQPSRQLAQAGVRAPSRANVSQVGAGYGVLAEVAKLGGATMDKFLRDKEAADFTEGQMKHVEGATLGELEDAGYSKSATEGYKMLDVQSGLNEFSAQQSVNIQGADAGLSPDDYQAKLGDAFAEFREALPDSQRIRDFANSAVLDMSSKLIREHTIRNADYVRSEATRSVSDLFQSTEKAGDPLALRNLLDNIDAVSPGLPGSTTRSAVSSALDIGLSEGSFLMWDIIGGSVGMRSKGFTEGQIASAKKHLSQAQLVQEADNTAENEAFETHVSRLIDAGESRSTIVQELETRRVSEHQSPAQFRSSMRSALAELSAQDETVSELNRQFDPELLDDLASLQQAVLNGRTSTADGLTEARALATKYDYPPDAIRPLLQKVVDSTNARQAVQDAETRKQLVKRAADEQLDEDANAWAAGGYRTPTTSKVKQRAADHKLNAILAGAATSSNDPTEQVGITTKAWASALTRDFDFVVDSVVSKLSIVSQSPPTTGDGSISSDHTEAFRLMSSLQEAGMGADRLKSYFGGAYEYMSVAKDLDNGAIDVTSALISAYNQTQRVAIKSTPKYTDAQFKDMLAINKYKAEQSFEPTAAFGNSQGAQYDDILSSNVKRAFEDSVDLDTFALRKAKQYSSEMPNMSLKAIGNLVAKDTANAFVYVNGSLVAPHVSPTGAVTTNLTAALGLEKDTGYQPVHMAFMAHIAFNTATFIPAGSDADRTTAQFIKETVRAGAVTTKLAAKDALTPFTLRFDEDYQRKVNDIAPYDVRMISSTEVIVDMYGDPGRTRWIGSHTVSLADVAASYELRKQQDSLDAAPSKERVFQGVSADIDEFLTTTKTTFGY